MMLRDILCFPLFIKFFDFSHADERLPQNQQNTAKKSIFVERVVKEK